MYQMATYAYYQFKVNSRYKMNNVFVVLSTFMAIMVQYYVWKYVEKVEHINTDIIAVYILCALSFSVILPIFSSADFIANKVLKGDIANLLHRPQSLFFINFSVQLGNTVYKLCYRVLPIWGLYAIFFMNSMTTWQRLENMFLIAISMLCSWILGFVIGNIIGFLSVVLISINGIKSFVSGMLLLFGGGLLPLDLYPDFLKSFVELSPFAAISYYPVAMVSGITSFNPVVAVEIQLFWIAVFGVILFWVHKKVHTKIDIMGG